MCEKTVREVRIEEAQEVWSVQTGNRHWLISSNVFLRSEKWGPSAQVTSLCVPSPRAIELPPPLLHSLDRLLYSCRHQYLRRHHYPLYCSIISCCSVCNIVRLAKTTHLPLEIILQIIDSLVIFDNERPIALPANDWRTIQLRTWMLVCKATSDYSTRHVYSYCMHINSNRKLMLLARTLSPPTGSRATTVDTKLVGTYKYIPYITSMFLAPFGRSLDDLPTATWIFELLSLVAPSLISLAFEFPFHTLEPANDHLGVY